MPIYSIPILFNQDSHLTSKNDGMDANKTLPGCETNVGFHCPNRTCDATRPGKFCSKSSGGFLASDNYT